MTTFKTIGAISWPSQKTSKRGWALSLDLKANGDDSDTITFHLKESISDSDVLALVGWAKEQKLEDWYSDMDKRSVNIMAYHHFNIPLSPAPHIDASGVLALYLQILHQCVLKTKKLLYMGGNDLQKEVKEQLIDLKREASPQIQDYPAIAALCYAVSAAYLWYRAPQKEQIPTHAEHIINSVEGKKDYESWVERFLNKENEVYSDNELW